MTGVFHYVDLLLTGLKVVILLAAVLFYVCYRKISAFMICLFTFEFIIIISTVLNHGNIKKGLVVFGTVVTACIFTELFIRHNAKKFIQSMAILVSTLIFINFIVMFFYPNGIAKMEYYGYTCNFLDIDNLLIPIFLFGMYMMILNSEWRYGSLSNLALLLIFCCTISLIKVWTAGGMIGMAVFLILVGLFYRRKIQKAITPVSASLVYVFLTLGLVVFRLQNLFSPLIEGVLKKSLTLTGRTDMWDAAYGLIAEKPILGRGVADLFGHILHNGKFQYGHNILIEILLVSGIVGFIAFIAIIFVVNKNLMQVKNQNWAVLALIIVFSIFTVGLIESYLNNVYFFLILSVGYMMPEILRQKAADSSAPEANKGIMPWLKSRFMNQHREGINE